MSVGEQRRVLGYRLRITAAVIIASVIAPLAVLACMLHSDILRIPPRISIGGLTYLIQGAMALGFPVALLDASLLAYLSRDIMRSRDRRAWTIVPLAAASLGAISVMGMTLLFGADRYTAADALATGAGAGALAGLSLCLIAMTGPAEPLRS